MYKNEFEAYAYTGFDWNNDEYTEDYPHKIVAHVSGKIETWQTKDVGGMLRYDLTDSEPYAPDKWIECNSDTGAAIDELTREMFDHYTASGLLFG
mgnify:CR=1 FL=1